MRPDSIEPQHKRWVESFATRVHRRMHAAGCRSMQVEDVRQECWVAWAKARNGYDQTRVAAFGTYLFRAMVQELNRWAAEQIGFAQTTTSDEDVMRVAECQYNSVNQEEVLATKQHRQEILNRMSARTRQVVELLDSPPQWLMDEFRAMRAKVDWCRSRGFFSSASRDLPLHLIYRAIGMTRTEQHRVHAEIRLFACSNG